MNKVVEIIIPFEGDIPTSRNRKICQKHSLGWMTVNRESKLEWPSMTLRCRDRNAHAYAVVCGPEDILGSIINEIARCCGVGLAAAGLAAIIAGPAAATPAFWAAFKACMIEKVGDKIDQMEVRLVVESETTDWGPC